MATTTNYSWTTPDDTDLVKDGAAAIRTLGSSIDTSVKALSPGTTAGDVDYYTTSTAKARLGIGTAGQVLTVNSGATAPEWATLPAPAGVPTGTVIFHAKNTAPSGFLKANGAAVDRTTYGDLFDEIGTTFGVGDGSTTFNVPDLRGYFPRGWADNGSIDSGRSFGSTQSATSIALGSQFTNGFPVLKNSDGTDGTDTVAGTAQSGTRDHTYQKVRPINIALLACIKF
jgi:phage-related tail fiber protein